MRGRRATSATVMPGIKLSAAILKRSAFVRRFRPLGPSITSSWETPTPIEPSNWTPISPSLAKSITSAALVRTECSHQARSGGWGSALRLPTTFPHGELKIHLFPICPLNALFHLSRNPLSWLLSWGNAGCPSRSFVLLSGEADVRGSLECTKT